MKRQSDYRKLSVLPRLPLSKFMTHVIVARWRPRDGQIEKIEAILRELAEKVRQEPGNLQFVVQRSHVRATMESKFWGAWRVARAAEIRAGGSLTLVTGYFSIRPRPGAAIVGAVNGALESLTRGLALELAPVRVNAVSPGTIDTPIRSSMPEAARSDMLAKAAAALPVGRVGVGEDIAAQILTFMTVGFATGSIVYIDGGALII